ncbi:hypothetical protein AMS68_000850 [Peltaster fructicola]|uniref:Restriction of telomere capping protein 4 n=1 Tax=Peltaster fructicola TaxID=286661 RepID=A0A6H0XKT2_9PEZI|nr:hypothetical protein AMS68_000850 [Peltaster fructicola]
MPALPRTSTRLLRTVRNKQHATEVDHEIESAQTETAALPTPPTSSSVEISMTSTVGPGSRVVEVEDYMQDPLSSDEEQPPPETHLEKLARHTAPEVSKRPSTASDSDDDIFGSALSSQQKRAKTTAFRKPLKPTIKYGSQSSQSSKSNANGKAASKFKQTKAAVSNKSTTKQPATFKTARGADIFVFGNTEETTTQMPSPTLSALSDPPESPGFEEVQSLERTPALKVRCDICRDEVDLLVKQEYEDQFGKGQRLNLKKQNAFCRFHKQQDARKTWKQRGYPEIDWSRLQERMAKQHQRLIAILESNVHSEYREELAKRIAKREDRTIQTTYANSTTPSRLSAGYYGPRGQKLMLEHISAHLSTQLREASLKDELISSVGVGGGVSGFVQSVLVPEMAIALIAQDLRINEGEARQVLDDSRALGELLHDEERERVPETLDLADSAVPDP